MLHRMTKKLFILAFVATILALVFTLIYLDCPGFAQTTIEEKMAFIDGNYPNKVKLARYAYLVKTLQKKTGNTREQIGDMTAAGQKVLLEDYGKKVSLLELLEGVNQSIPAGVKLKYQEVMALYVMLLGD